MTVVSSGQPGVPATGGFALWNLGFRPFYLLAAVFSAFSVVLWAAQVSGYLPVAYLQGPVWHGHEMLFGYTVAIIAGFLLTAVRNWTGESTPEGAPLMALVALWVCGRILALTSYGLAAAAVNAAFLLAVAVAIGIPLVRSRNIRNYFFIGLLLIMSALAIVVHLGLHGRLNLSPHSALQVGLDVVLFIMAVMGGRVIPMFTNNGVPGAGAARMGWIEKLALAAVIALLIADLLQLSQTVIALFAAICALAHAMRLALWKPWRTLGTPLVWILHAAYAWIVIHFTLRALTAVDALGGTVAMHALTTGAIGAMTLGMMTRTARGHTGRPLLADAFELTMFVLIQVAALIRVFGAMVLPGLYLQSIQISSVLWAAAFGLFAVRYWPVLTRPRLDGRPG